MFALATSLVFLFSPNFYRLETRGHQSWFVTPEGKPFWSLGVDCVDLGETPEKWNAKNPGYSGLRLFPDERAWTLDTLQKFQKWGVNSLGAWSSPELFAKYAPSQRLPHFECLHLASYNKAPYNDLFSKDTAKAIDDAARDQIAKLSKDPSLVGYFTDNELGWWDGYLFSSYLKFEPNAPGRRRLQSLIRRFYRSDFRRFQKDWISAADSFDGFDAKPELKLRPGGNGMRLVRAWMTEMGKYYYRMVHDSIRKYDPNRLILGDRYCQFYVPEIAAASAPFIDVASTNYGAEWTNGKLSRFFLDSLHSLTKKPVIITEFYMTAMENRSGNKNSSGGFPIVATQVERSAAFHRNLVELSSLPYVIGAHWFQFWDEPAAGRGDGEDYNMGLVDTKGVPYDGMVDAIRRANVSDNHARSKPFTPSETVTRAIKSPLSGLRDWDLAKAFVPANTPSPMGDLYMSWAENRLYFGLIAMDYVDESLYEGGKLPAEDRALWRIRINGGKPVEVRFQGEKQPAVVTDPGVQLSEIAGLKHQVVAGIPVPKGLAPGAELSIECDLFTHGRADHVAWKRKLRLVP
jgi:hypothetical protein